MRKYKSKSGLTQFMPSIQEVMLASEEQSGFCLACGNEQGGVEPNARRHECEACGANKVYGVEELVCYDDSAKATK